ncbi:MAG: hypothetical protein ABIS84_02285 [Arachnia sp.]
MWSASVGDDRPAVLGTTPGAGPVDLDKLGIRCATCVSNGPLEEELTDEATTSFGLIGHFCESVLLGSG